MLSCSQGVSTALTAVAITPICNDSYWGNEENAEQDPGRCAREEQGIAASRVIEKKLQRLSE